MSPNSAPMFADTKGFESYLTNALVKWSKSPSPLLGQIIAVVATANAHLHPGLDPRTKSMFAKYLQEYTAVEEDNESFGITDNTANEDMVDAQLIISARQLLRVDRLEYKGDDLATVEQVLEEMAKYIDAPFGL